MARRPDPDRLNVVDLKRRRAELDKRNRARAKAQAQSSPQASNGSQPLLGSRRNAGLILAVVAVVLFALWLGPALLRLG